MERVIVGALPDYTVWSRGRLGSFSRTCDDNSTKYIVSSFAIENEGHVDTPSFWVARDLSSIKFSKLEQAELLVPQYAVPVTIPEGVYVDIRRAYFQIASRLGAECVVRDGKLIAKGSYRFSNDIYTRYKICRALIMSATVKESRSQIWENGRIKNLRNFNRLYAPSLQWALKATLQSVADECRKYIAYFHTDGMIVPSFSLSKVEKILDSWGLEFSIKHTGFTSIRGIGNYSVGDYKSRGMALGPTSNLVKIDNWKKEYSKIL